MADLYIDADSLPQKIMEIVVRRILKDKLEAVFVADRELPYLKDAIAKDTTSRRDEFRATLPKEELKKIKSGISMIVVESDMDSADNEIVNICTKPAIAITHDILLASRLLEKGLIVIDDRGREFTRDNIRYVLSLRGINNELRQMGKEYERSERFKPTVYNQFANCFDRSLQKLILRKT